jgi:hypothetical protein
LILENKTNPNAHLKTYARRGALRAATHTAIELDEPTTNWIRKIDQ